MVTIYLDFDGTVVKGPYPDMSEGVTGSIAFIKKLQGKGYKIVLNTYRANINPQVLQEAILYLDTKGVKVDGVLSSKKQPHPYKMIKHKMATQHGFPIDIYIDDIAYHMPLISDGKVEYVNYKKVEEDFVKIGLL